MPNVVEMRVEIEEIKKMVAELYERSMVVKSVVETVIPIFEVPNIWADLADGQVELT